MEFRVLGSLEVWDGPAQIEVGGTMRRALLALLVLRANEVVGKDRLIDDLWGDDAPRTAAASLHNHISRLRKALGQDRLSTRAWGYVLRVEPEEVDLQRFERWTAEADPLPALERSARLAGALALFRGPVLADLAYEPALGPEIARLEELRLAALEARIDADLELGRSSALIAELEALIAEHPLRERLRGQLILALYRDGRQAEALEVYREIRRLLVDELGLEPSPALRELERAILCQDPALASAAPPAEPVGVEPASGWSWPRSLFVIVPALLLLAGGGLAVAMSVTRNRGGDQRAAISTTDETVTVLRQLPGSTSRGQRPVSKDRKPDQTAKKARRSRSTAASAHRKLAAVLVRSAPSARELRTSHRVPSSRSAGSSRGTNHANHPPSQEIYLLADDFTDPAVDSGLWNVSSHGTGVQVAEQNGRLEFSISPDVVYDQSVSGVDQHYGTNCYMPGNFDARIDFKLLNWPEDDGVLLSLGVWTPPPHEDFWSVSREGQTANSTSEGYLAQFGGRGQWAPTTDTSGALRLRRDGATLTAYYHHKRRWVRLFAEYGPGPASLVVSLVAQPGGFGNLPARAAFDNFRATAQSVSCPPGTPLPPRMPRQ